MAEGGAAWAVLRAAARRLGPGAPAVPREHNRLQELLPAWGSAPWGPQARGPARAVAFAGAVRWFGALLGPCEEEPGLLGPVKRYPEDDEERSRAVRQFLGTLSGLVREDPDGAAAAGVGESVRELLEGSPPGAQLR